MIQREKGGDHIVAFYAAAHFFPPPHFFHVFRIAFWVRFAGVHLFVVGMAGLENNIWAVKLLVKHFCSGS